MQVFVGARICRDPCKRGPKCAGPSHFTVHVVVLQRMTKKCTKNFNARAELLFC